MPLWFLKGTYIKRYLFLRSIVARYTFLAFVKAPLKNMREDKVDASVKSCVYPLMKRFNDHEGLGPNEIAAESTNLLVAGKPHGSDTTSTVLSAFVFYLSRSSSSYAKVASEIRSVPRSSTDLRNRSLRSFCPYIRACIDESMRLAPPIPSALFWETESGGAFIDDHFIPAGYDIGTSIYSIYHNSKYFTDPFRFWPERWLLRDDRSNKDEIDLAHSAFTPFSIGPRSCIGKVLSLVELQSVLVNVFFHFDFRIAEGELGNGGEGKAGAV